MIIIKLLKLKYSFKKNKKVEILLLDDNYANLKFKNRTVSVLNFQELNLYYFLKSIFYYFFKNSEKLKIKRLYWKLLIT